MKKDFLSLLLCGIAAPAMAQDFRAPMHRAPQPRPAHVVPKPGFGGAVVNVSRQGNPLQLVNPLAPREYGTGEEYVYHGSESPASSSEPATNTPPNRKRAIGIKLFAFEW